MKTRKYKKHYINHKKTIKRKKAKQLFKKTKKYNNKNKNNKNNKTKKRNKRFFVGGVGENHPTRNATPGEMNKPQVKQVPVNPDIANQKQGNLRNGDTSYSPFPSLKLDDRSINFSTGQEGVKYDGEPLPTMPNILNPKYEPMPQEYKAPTREGKPGDMRETPGAKQVPVNPEIHGNLRGTDGKPASLFSWTSSFASKTIYTAGAMAAGAFSLGLGTQVAFASFITPVIGDQLATAVDGAKITQILTPIARTAYAAGVSAEEINKFVNDILKQRYPSFSQKWNFDISEKNGAMRMGTTNFVKQGDVIADLGLIEEIIGAVTGGVIITHMNNYLHEVTSEQQQKQRADETPSQNAKSSTPINSLNDLKNYATTIDDKIIENILDSVPVTDAEAELVNDNIQIITESLKDVREKRHNERVNARMSTITNEQQESQFLKNKVGDKISSHNTRADTIGAIESEMPTRIRTQQERNKNAEDRTSAHNTRADTIGAIESEMPTRIRTQQERREYAARRIAERNVQSDMDMDTSNQALEDFDYAVRASSRRIAERNASHEEKMRSRNAKLQAFAEIIMEQYAQDTIPEYVNASTPIENQYDPKPGEDYRKAKEEFIKTNILKHNNTIQRVDEKTALDNTVYLTSILGAYVFRCITKKIAAGKKKHFKNYNRQRELQIMHGENVIPPQIQSYLRRGEIPMEYTQGNALANLDQYRRGNYSFVSNEGWEDEPLQLQVPLDEGVSVTGETTSAAPRTTQPIRSISPATPAMPLATPRTLMPLMMPATPQTPMPIIGNTTPPKPELQITTTKSLPTSMNLIEQPLVEDTMKTSENVEDEEEEEDELEPVDIFIEAVKTEVTSRRLVKGDAKFKEEIKDRIDKLTSMANDDENDVINNRIQNLGIIDAFNNGVRTIIERYPDNVNEELKAFIINFLDRLLITFRSNYNNDNEEDEEYNEGVIYNREEDERNERNEGRENERLTGIHDNIINVNTYNRSY